MTCGISIHALREEGDAVQAKNSGTYTISIHALREEGDYASRSLSLSVILFLSTPSARRATSNGLLNVGGQAISIHALREEGD